MTTNDSLYNTDTLAELGFSPYFRSQLSLDELEQLQPVRIIQVQRDRMHALSEAGVTKIMVSGADSTGDFAVGDWVLVNQQYL